MHSNWKTVKLGDIAKLITSGSRGWAAYYADEGVKFIRMTNLPRHGINMKLDDLKYVKLPANNSEGSRTRLQEGDVLVSITAELGKIGYVPSDLGEAYINQHVALVRLDKTKVIPKMVAYILSTTSVRNSLNRRNDSGAKAGLNLPTIQKFPILIPDLEQQRNIVSILETWDKELENLNKKIVTKKRIKKGLMQQLLTGKMRLPGYKDEWRELTLAEIGSVRTSSVDKLSIEGQKQVKLLNYMDVYKRDHIKSTDQFQIVTAKDQQLLSSDLRMGDILFTPSSETQSDIGHSAVVIENLDNVLFSYHLVRLRPKNNFLNHRFSAYAFKTNEFYRELWKRAQGATRYTLSKEAIEESVIRIPTSINEQLAIAKILEYSDKEIAELERKLRFTQEQHRYLLNSLVSGKIEAENVKNVELQYA